MSFQKITIQGVLPRDAVLEHTAAGTPYARFCIPVNRIKEGTDWFKCKLWGEKALKVSSYLKKCTSVIVTGKMRFMEQEKDGVKFHRHEVLVDELSFCERSKSDKGGEK